MQGTRSEIWLKAREELKERRAVSCGITHPNSAWHIFRTRFIFPFLSLFTWPDYCPFPWASVGSTAGSWWIEVWFVNPHAKQSVMGHWLLPHSARALYPCPPLIAANVLVGTKGFKTFTLWTSNLPTYFATKPDWMVWVWELKLQGLPFKSAEDSGFHFDNKALNLA